MRDLGKRPVTTCEEENDHAESIPNQSGSPPVESSQEDIADGASDHGDWLSDRRNQTILKNVPIDGPIPSAKAPYQRIKRSGPRQAAVSMQHFTYLKQIGLAIHTFHTIYGQLPVGESPRENYPIKYRDGNPLLSWRVHLLPFLEHEPLYATI